VAIAKPLTLNTLRLCWLDYKTGSKCLGLML
jgi:hypothetical protein